MSIYGTVQQLTTSLSTGAIASQLIGSVTSNVTGQVADNLKNNENIKNIQDNVKTTFDSYTDKIKTELKESSASNAVEKAIEDVKLRKEYISQEVATAMVNKRNMGGTETEVSGVGAETMKKLVDGSITETLPNYPNSVNETVVT
jgi:microcompartment protein CcmL/EutN